MRFYRVLAALALAAPAGGAASAEPATPEGARAIESDYAAYLGQKVVDAGIVSVAPDDDGYVVTWNLRKALDLAAPTPGTVTIEPLSYRLIPGADGVWTLKGEHFPRVGFNLHTEKGQASGAFNFDGFRFGGRYDPSAVEFLRSTLGVDTLQGAFQMENGDQRSQFELAEDGLTIEARARPTATGPGVNLAVAQAFSRMNESISAPSRNEGGEPNAMNYAASSAIGGATIAGLRARELGDLWKYVVTHMDQTATPADLNARIRAALPFWNDIDVHAEVHDLKMETPDGEARLARLGESFGMTGATATGAARLGVEIEGLEVKSDLAPSWLGEVWPASLDLKVSISGGAWDEAARIALDDPGFGEKADLSPESRARIQRALLAGHPSVILAPGRLKLPFIDLAFSGEAAARADGLVGHFELSADNLDKTIALLGEAGETAPAARGAMLAATFLKGLAKTGDDGRLAWKIDIDPHGHMDINGEAVPVGP